MSGGYFYEDSDFYLNALVSMVHVFVGAYENTQLFDGVK